MNISTQGKKWEGIGKSVICGLLTTVLAMLLLTGVSTAMVMNGILREEYIDTAVMMTHFMSVLMGCFVITTIKKDHRLLCSVVVGVGYTLLLITSNALVFGADFLSLTGDVAAISVGVLVSLLSIGRGHNRQRKKLKKHKW